MGATQSCVPCSHQRAFDNIDISVDEPAPFMQEMKVMKSYKVDGDALFVKNNRTKKTQQKRQRQNRSRARRPQVQDPMYFSSSKVEVEVVQPRQRQCQNYGQAQAQQIPIDQVSEEEEVFTRHENHVILRGFTKSGIDLKINTRPHIILRGFGSKDIKLERKQLDSKDEVFKGLHGPVTLHEGNLITYTSLDGKKHTEVALKAHLVKKSFPNGISYGGLKKSIWFGTSGERDRLFDAIGQTFQVFQGIRDTVVVNMYYGVTYTDINGTRFENVTFDKDGLRKTFPLGISYGDLPKSIFFADEEERDLTFALMAGRMENPSVVKPSPILESFPGLKFRVNVHMDGKVSYSDITGTRQANVKYDATRIRKTFPNGISYGDLPKSIFFKDEKTRDNCFEMMLSQVFTGLHGSVAVSKTGKVTYTAITGDRFKQVKFDADQIRKTFPKGISYGDLPKSIFFASEAERDSCIKLMRGDKKKAGPTAPVMKKAAPALDSIYTMQFMSSYEGATSNTSTEQDFMDLEVSVCETVGTSDPVESAESTQPVTNFENVLTDYKCYNYLLSGEENRVEVKIYKDLSLDILQKVAISPTLQPTLFGIDPKLKIQRVYEHGPDLVVVSEHVSLTLKDVLNDNSYTNVSQLAKMYITYELIKSVAELHENGVTMKLLSSLSVWVCRDGRITLSGFLEQAMRRLKTQIVCASDDEMEANPLVLLKWRQRDVYRLGQLIARLFLSNNVVQWVKTRLDIPTEFDSYPDVKAVLYQKNVPKSIIQIICRCLRTKREGPLVHASMNEILGYAHYGICNDFDLEAGRQDLSRYLDEEHDRLMF